MQLFKATCGQLLALAIVWLAAPWLASYQLTVFWLILLQAAIASLLALALHQPVWWLPIHLGFLPTLWLTLSFTIPSHWFLAAFVLLLLIFWGTVKGEVPLFLSSSAVSQALLEIIADERPANFLEIGAGIGSVVVPLARKLPNLPITAIENAPLPWLILHWRCRNLSNVTVLRSNFWECDFAAYAMAFAFLSPLVMPRIGQKCRTEMGNGGLLVSSSFALPEQQPTSVLTLNDSRQTRLYCYRRALKKSVNNSAQACSSTPPVQSTR